MSEHSTNRYCGGFYGRSALSARDRVLLYMRGMDLCPLQSVDLALQSLIRAKEDDAAMRSTKVLPGGGTVTVISDSPEDANREVVAAIREMRSILRENGIRLQVAGEDGKLLRSAPPMNRQSMIAEDMDISLIPLALRRLFGGGRKAPKTGRGPAPAGAGLEAAPAEDAGRRTREEE